MGIESTEQRCYMSLIGIIKFMRQFYETWCNDLKSLTVVGEIGDNKSLTGISEIDTQLLIPSENTQKESFDAVSFLGF